MVQIVTVSAQTAHYASDMGGMYKPQKVTRSSFAEAQTNALAEQAKTSEDYTLRAMASVVQPPAFVLFWLTGAKTNYEQATLGEALDAYQTTGT